LAATAESSKGIEHARAQEADKTKHNDLGYGVIVDTPQAFRLFVYGDRVIIRGVRAATFLVARTGHGEEMKKGLTMNAYGFGSVPTFMID